jgi:hypothetical protein
LSPNLSSGSKIFVSSTFTDFKNFRYKLFSESQRILNGNLTIEAMEFYGAETGEPIKVCLQKLKTCNIYLGVIGKRYGSIDDKSGKSYTQLEYECAKKLLKTKQIKHIWIYLPSEKCKFSGKESEDDPEKLKKLNTFIKLIQKNHTPQYYHNMDDLRHKIILDIVTKIPKKIKTNLSIDGESEYDKYLDSTYDPISIEGYTFHPSEVLRMDEELYKECLLAWQDSQQLSKLDGS